MNIYRIEYFDYHGRYVTEIEANSIEEAEYIFESTRSGNIISCVLVGGK